MGFKELNIELHRIIYLCLIILYMIITKYKKKCKNLVILFNILLLFGLYKNISYALIILLMNIEFFSAD